MAEPHGELPFDLKENLSDVDFTAEDVKEEVEFTLHTVRRRCRRSSSVWFPRILCCCCSVLGFKELPQVCEWLPWLPVQL